jgi:hypothetical protein
VALHRQMYPDVLHSAIHGNELCFTVKTANVLCAGGATTPLWSTVWTPCCLAAAAAAPTAVLTWLQLGRRRPGSWQMLAGAAGLAC